MLAVLGLRMRTLEDLSVSVLVFWTFGIRIISFILRTRYPYIVVLSLQPARYQISEIPLFGYMNSMKYGEGVMILSLPVIIEQHSYLTMSLLPLAFDTVQDARLG